MGRLFLTLYGVLALALAAYVVGLEFLPETLLRHSTRQFYERVMGGAFHLIEEQLKERPESSWRQVIGDLQPTFDYPLALERLEPRRFSAAHYRLLMDGRVIVDEIDGADYLYKRVGGSDYFIAMAMEDTRDEASLRSARGAANLVIDRIRQRSRDQWPAVVEELQTVFGIPLSIRPISEVQLSAKRQRKLQQGELVVVDNNQAAERYYQRIGDSLYVLKAGPIGQPFLIQAFAAIVLIILAVLVAVAVYAWVRPVWRDLSTLDRTAAAFGQGDFAARMDVSSRAALRGLAEAFNGMADRIQRLIRSHQDLTNAVSHELRTPVARLRFGIDMLQDATEERDRQRYVSGMRADIDELDALIAELLTYARFDRDGPNLVFNRRELGKWLEEFIGHMRHETEKVAVVLNSHGSECDDEAAFEPRLMARALGNLLRNARRHARERVEVGYEIQNGLCRLWVDDDGPGIPAEERERILEPFARLDDSRDRTSGGVGLGLAIVRQIMSWHGGQVAVTESPAGGARLTLRWPSAGPG